MSSWEEKSVTYQRQQKCTRLPDAGLWGDQQSSCGGNAPVCRGALGDDGVGRIGGLRECGGQQRCRGYRQDVAACRDRHR